jgi:hypothetical protein
MATTQMAEDAIATVDVAFAKDLYLGWRRGRPVRWFCADQD